MSNSTQLAGEVEVADFAVIGGGTLVHQFTHIGKHTMIQGGSKVTKDIPPFVTVGREPITYAGINSIGLRRRGYTNEQINNVQDIYRLIYNSGLNTSDAIAKIESEFPATVERDEILLFVRNSARGIIK
jgi:UDP-N-acetylglucosamine acyltransferase